MGFCFSKPDKSEILADNRKTILDNSTKLSACAALCDVGEIKDEVLRIKDKAYYFTPTSNATAMQVDKKIANLAGDLKIALSRANRERSEVEAREILKQLDAACEERLAATNM